MHSSRQQEITPDGSGAVYNHRMTDESDRTAELEIWAAQVAEIVATLAKVSAAAEIAAAMWIRDEDLN